MASTVQDLDGKYRLGRVLKEGDRAVVMAATHIEMREPVIVKVLHADERDERFAAKLRRTARQSAALRSEHVVRYLDVGHLPDQRPYVVMERLKGETLAERIVRAGPLTVPQAADALLQTCEALAWAHVRGIIHRDLRTSNLFCTEQPDERMFIKVLNFGTSRSVDSGGVQEDQGMTVTSLKIDAPDYKAPEQIVSRSQMDTRVDTWALGVILYEMLTGQHPFDAPTQQEVVNKILSADIAPAPQLSVDIWRVIRGCINRKRQDRWDSVATVADAIAFAASTTTASYPTRIRKILSTPVNDEPEIEEEPHAPAATIITGSYGLGMDPLHDTMRDAGRAHDTIVTSPAFEPKRPMEIAKLSDNGLPRIDNGHTSARKLPWVHIGELGLPQKSEGNQGKRVAVILGAGVMLALLIVGGARLVFEKKPVESASSATPATTPKGVTTTSIPDPAAPAEPAPVSKAAEVAPTPTAAAAPPAKGAGARAPTGGSSPQAGVRPPGSPTTAAPRGSAEGDNPWGWNR